MPRIIFEDETSRKRKIRLLVIIVGAMILAVSFWILIRDGEAESKQHVEEAAPERTEGREFRPKSRSVEPRRGTSDSPPNCSVTDGDTLKCGTRNIRLLGLDAPELPGHCRQGRKCVEGDPFAASSALQALIDVDSLEILVVGKDHYGRDLANVYANGQNVGCKLIEGGYAIYVAEWDDGEKLRRDCGLGT